MCVCKFIGRPTYINIHKYMYYLRIYIWKNTLQRLCETLVASREQNQLAGWETGLRGRVFVAFLILFLQLVSFES